MKKRHIRRALRNIGLAALAGLVIWCIKGFPLPTPEMLRRYFALGGRLITFGSDAHQPRRVGENRDWAEHLAREIGFTEWCVFQGRKRLLLPLG